MNHSPYADIPTFSQVHGLKEIPGPPKLEEITQRARKAGRGRMSGDGGDQRSARGELILYSTEDGRAEIQLRAEQGTVWLTQAHIAELFDTTKQNVSLHVRNILADGELGPSVVKESLIPASDGKRYRTKIYNLDAILAVG